MSRVNITERNIEGLIHDQLQPDKKGKNAQPPPEKNALFRPHLFGFDCSLWIEGSPQGLASAGYGSGTLDPI